MVTLWYTKVKYGLSELEDVRDVYRAAVLVRLIENGFYDEDGNRLKTA